MGSGIVQSRTRKRDFEVRLRGSRFRRLYPWSEQGAINGRRFGFVQPIHAQPDLITLGTLRQADVDPYPALNLKLMENEGMSLHIHWRRRSHPRALLGELDEIDQAS